MTEPSLPELEAERDRLYAQLGAVGDFRRGSVTENYRKCGKPNCACAGPDHPGHGPRFLWTRSAAGAERRRPAARGGRRWRRCAARWPGMRSSRRSVEQIAEVNEKICEARPIAGTDAPSVPEGEKGGSSSALAEEKAAEIGRLAAEAARSLGCGDAGLEAAEAVIRAGMLKLGGGMLEQLLAADPGYRGPRVLRQRAPGGVRLLPGQGHRHRARPGHPHARLVSLRGLQARLRAARRRAGRGGRVPVAGAGRDERPGRGRRAVREGRRAAGGPGRGPADRQARRAGGRGQRRRRGRGRPGPGRG